MSMLIAASIWGIIVSMLSWGNRALVSVVTATALVASALLVPFAAAAEEAPPAEESTTVAPLPDTVSADALPTVQIDDGVVWTQTIVGNTVYAAGQFSNVRPAGSAKGENLSARGNIVAYDLETGELISSFSPSFNNRINEVVGSPDGTKLYVTGSFTQVNGQNRSRFAVIDLTTGNLLPNTVGLNNIGKAVYATEDGVFVGGYFTAVGSQQRMRIAKLNPAGTQVLPFSIPVDTGQVQSIVTDPTGTQVMLSGNFLSVGGSDDPGYGLYRADVQTGAGLPLAVNSHVRNAGNNSGVMALATDGTKFYGVGWGYGGGNLEGSFAGNWSDGSLVWVEDCHGDTYDIAIANGISYSASHKHYCGNSGGFPQTNPWSFYHATAWTTDVRGVNTADIYGYADRPGTPRPELLNWYPQTTVGSFTGQGQAVWAVNGNDDYVIYGGEFPSVNGTRQYGLVRFAKRSIAPNQQGPRLSGTNWQQTVTSFSKGSVRLSYKTNWDRDDYTLTYRVYRDSETSTPISEETIGAHFWAPTTQTVDDEGLEPGASHRYRVTATDPYGNVAKSPWVSVTVSDEAVSPYATGVLDDGAVNFWRLGESSGTTVIDWAGSNDLTLNGTATRGATGAVEADPNTATSFAGAFGAAANAAQAPNAFSVEAWIKTTTTQGGKIVGYGNATTGQSSSHDRHVYMDNSGRILFGVYPGSARTINSTDSYNDGEWHHVVASLGSNGMTLYVDGKRVAQRADTTTAQQFTGVWRVGGDNISGWPSQPTSSTFAGDIDEVAVYNTPLTTSQVREHYTRAGGSLDAVNPPADEYGSLVYNSNPDFYWRYDETSGATVADSGEQQVSGVIAGAYNRGDAGALENVSGSALTFTQTTCQWWQIGCTSTNGGSVATSINYAAPSVYTAETWFKTSSTAGGRVIGFSSNQTGSSSSYDRHVYMQDDGKLVFGVWPNQSVTVTTDDAYNDGEWHHVAASQGPDGMKLYVDGELAGSNPQTGAQPYTGYWRVGGDTTWGSSSTNLIGSFDETAVYSRVLADAEVSAHYLLGTGQEIPNQVPVAAFESVLNGLTLSVDAVSSTDADGEIVEYAWDFGDGETAEGVSATHTYESEGTYEVTLVVTDDDGAETELTQEIEVVAPNVEPVAEFSSTVDGLGLSVDAAGSSDSDGEIVSYEWDFGDGSTGTGVTASHTYEQGGTKAVTLTVTDDEGAVGSITQFVDTVAPNVDPVAEFSSVVDGLGVSVDAAGSSDSDGSIVSYEWDFGDESTGSGVEASHTYESAGTYTISLTVTDDRGGVDESSQEVTVEEGPVVAGPLFADTFSRQVASGWGSADQGGDWTLRTGATRFSVADGVGKVAVPRASTIAADTPVVDALSTRFDVTFSMDSVNEATYVGAVTRRVDGDQYMVRIRVGADGTARLHVLRGTSSPVGAAVETGVVIEPGAKYRFVVDTKTVSASTSISAKVWKDGTTEPDWQIERTNAQAGLQVAGSAGLYAYVPNSAAGTVNVSFDNLTITDPDAEVPAEPEPNVDPVAEFSSSVDGLAVSVDAGGSSDSDGDIVSYAWDFGDDSTATGVAATHTYEEAGTYEVSLTVTDDRGGVHTLTQEVTVEGDPVEPQPNVDPVAEFSSVVDGLGVSVDAAGSSDSDGSIVSYEWDFGDESTGSGVEASHTYESAGTYTISLTVTDDRGGVDESSQEVTVEEGPVVAGPLFADTFSRQVASGWGSADQGGDWTLRTGATRFSVADGVGKVAVPRASTIAADTPVVDALSTRFDVTFSMDSVNEATYVGAVTRRVDGDQYMVRIRVGADGTARLHVLRGTSSPVGAAVETGVVIEPGAKYRFVVDTKTVSASTSISAKVWKDGTTEPDWQIERTNAQAGLQVAGSAGLYAYVPNSAAGTVNVSFDNLTITEQD